MILQSLSSIALTEAGRKQLAPEEKHAARRRRESTLIFMEKGVLHFLENGSPVTLTSGEYYIQKKGHLHETLPNQEDEEPARYIFIHFLGGTYTEKGMGIPLRGTYSIEAIKPFTDVLLKKTHANCFRLTAMLYSIFSILEDQIADYEHTGDLLDMLRYRLETSHSEKLTLSELSKEFGYHPVHLSRLFSERYGTTIHQYQIEQKMTHANWMLHSTNATVAEVAQMVGYQDPSAFYRAYLAHYNEPPRAKEKTGSAKPE